MSRCYIEREKLTDHVHLSEQVVEEMIQATNIEVESPRRTEVGEVEAEASSTSLYRSISFAEDDFIFCHKLKELGLRKFGENTRLRAKASCQFWKEK